MEKPNSGKEYERADQRDRHRQQRNQRGAPALKKEVDDQDHQDERDHQRFDDFLIPSRRHRVVSSDKT